MGMIRVLIGLSLGLALVPAPATDAANDNTGSEGIASTCSSRAAETRWSGGTYVVTHTYGLRDSEWIGSIGGIRAESGQLVVYDRSFPRVVVLSDSLRRLRSFGRAGKGPGEFPETVVPGGPIRIHDQNRLAIAGPLAVVYDGEGFEAFSLESGSFHHDVPRISAGMFFSFGIRFIESHDAHEILFAVDSFDVQAKLPRRLQTWSLNGSQRTKIWEITIPEPPRPRPGAFSMPARQARPLWAVSGDCVVVSDGASPFLLRYSTRTGAVDTLRLPDRPLPDVVDSGRARPGIAEAVRRRTGRAVTIGGDVQPTSVVRWSALAVDPDGHAWIRPWVDSDSELPALVRVDLQDGEVTEERLPAFPSAFGGPGVYYAIGVDDATDQTILLRYERR